MRTMIAAIGRSLSFVQWGLRQRAGQVIPVAIAFFLLTAATQTIGTLHDIASIETQQKIAQSWRMPYDLYVRSPSSVSQPERSAGWIDPQSILESYGGINARQLASIAALPHVAQVLPFATIGWQSIAIQVPLFFTARGVYRLSAIWTGQEIASDDDVYYVDVTDLSHLTSEVSVSSPIVEHLVLKDNTPSVMFAMPIEATQAIIGVPDPRQKSLFQGVLSDSMSPSAIHLSVHVDKLSGNLATLSTCVQRAACWEPEHVRQGPLHYQVDGVQVMRYSRTDYVATSQQLAAGQIAMMQPGADIRGPLYRELVAEHVVVQDRGGSDLLQGVGSSQEIPLLPLSGPERLPLLTNAMHFIPLTEACTINGANCYSGLFVRLQGVEHYSQNSLALLQATAAAITAHTGLHADILDGSSLRTVSILTSAGHGRVVVPSSWRVVGVAVQIVHGLDALQETLLVLCASVCLLAIGAAGVLVGVGRRKEVLLLQQIGWQSRHLLFILTLDALLLCLPGCMLAISWLVLSTTFWVSNLQPGVVVLLLFSGILVYCCLCVAMASSVGLVQNVARRRTGRQGERKASQYRSNTENRGRDRIHRVRREDGQPVATSLTPMADAMNTVPMAVVEADAMNTVPTAVVGASLLYEWYCKATTQASIFHLKATARITCGIATAAAVFLLAMEYLLVADFNQVLVVTVLGKQVRAVLEGSQLALLMLILAAALLTVGLCTRLLLRARREEIVLLARVGWDQRFVILRMLWDNWKLALLSGEVGVLIALGVTMLGGASPSLLVGAVLVFSGPLIAMLLVSIVALGPVWQETKRVYAWR